MRPPSVSVSRSTRASHFRVKGLPVSPKDTKVRQMRKLVALKIRPEAFEVDPGRLACFQREVQFFASLNHPNTPLEDRAGRIMTTCKDLT